MCDLSGAWKEKARQLEVELEAEKRKVQQLEVRLDPPDPPVMYALIGKEQIYDLLLQVFPGQWNKIYMSDKKYYITSIQELRRFVEWDNTDIFEYESDIHDCDDFAMALAGDFAKYPAWSGYPVSFVWGDLPGGHAFAIAVAWTSLEDRTPCVYYIEPQDDHEIAAESVEDMELILLPM